MTDLVVYDHAIDGALNRVVLSAANAKRVTLWTRDIQFGVTDRLGFYVSEDDGVTKESAAAEYEARVLGVSESTGGSSANAGFTFSAVVVDNTNLGPHDAVVDIEGLASAIIRTSFRSHGSDSLVVHDKYNNRATAAVENAIVIQSLGGQNMTGGQIIARIET